jgi:mRNA interferase RelE/StbE
MVWRIEIAPAAKKELDKIDRQTAQRILTFLEKRIAPLKNPRTQGEALTGRKFGEYWRYRVGDYRMIARIKDDVLLVLVLRIGHREDVYK